MSYGQGGAPNAKAVRTPESAEKAVPAKLLVRPRPNRNVVNWVDNQPGSETHITAITLAELLYAVARLPTDDENSNLPHKPKPW